MVGQSGNVMFWKGGDWQLRNGRERSVVEWFGMERFKFMKKYIIAFSMGVGFIVGIAILGWLVHALWNTFLWGWSWIK